MTTLILGYGAVGQATADLLTKAGRSVRIAQRTRPATLDPKLAFQPCDVLDADSVRKAADGASQIVLAIGFPYLGKVWRRHWPLAMANVLAAAEQAQARIVFVDNLYMYGPQTAPLTETMAMSDHGAKPSARAAITRQWMAASGRVRFAAVRAPDFYGPGVRLSHVGDTGFAAIAKGKPASLIVPPDTPHDFAYVPDFARAVVSLLDAPDDCFGQAWHVPCAPTRTPREILALGAAAAGRKLKIQSIPLALAPVLGLALPFFREIHEMRFQWDRPYTVDASKFAKRFWSDPTPFEVGAAATMHSFEAAVS